ncbi:four-carbon acid sugar kinase family protein [Acidimangrovimonas sediminis]|uniref:four-carbon acid sugar kinase family protein n=1 Tax=Acidimangrovimonas sediminis TaxID=2056283 RepID=UPI000C80432F|nr:four-carbon acid sugar kinase family protein [Acidimangrovimonas sediminis]
MSGGIVFIGDDFTGASDSLSTYARAGRATRLRLDPWQGESEGAVEVTGFATDLRSRTPEEAVAVIGRLWPEVARLAPRILHYKVCSTFDSAPRVGSIGAAVAALSARFRPDVTAIIGGQPSLGRYCAFGTLFARGPDGAIHRIDRHPIMARHPVTPMAEADLARHLAAQGLTGVVGATLPELGETHALAARLRAGPVLFDATGPGDQVRIGTALARAGGRQLIVGASSVAEILAPGTGRATAPDPPTPPLPPPPPPPGRAVVIFAGSRSSVTARQVAAATGFRRVPLDPATLARGAPPVPAVQALAEGVPLLLHLLPEAAYDRGPGEIADLAAALLARLCAGPAPGWLGLAGGDSSSRVVAGLGFSALEFVQPLAPGVALCAARHPDPARDGMRILLKGGQLGPDDLFDRFRGLAEG